MSAPLSSSPTHIGAHRAHHTCMSSHRCQTETPFRMLPFGRASSRQAILPSARGTHRLSRRYGPTQTACSAFWVGKACRPSLVVAFVVGTDLSTTCRSPNGLPLPCSTRPHTLVRGLARRFRLDTAPLPRTLYLQPTPSLLCCACLEPPRPPSHHARPQESLPWLVILVVQPRLVSQTERAPATCTGDTSHVAKGKCARPYVSAGLVHLPVARSRDSSSSPPTNTEARLGLTQVLTVRPPVSG